MSDPPPPGFRRFVRDWNEAQGQGTPRLHRNIAAWLDRAVRRGRQQLLLLVFRGGGKSTMTGLLCAWLLLRRPDSRILVLAADLTLAVKMVRNVRRIVERHPACAALLPKPREQWAADQFTVARASTLRDPSVLGAGLLGNITGSRAEVVICDDVEVPNNSGSPPRREDLRERLAEIDYILVPGGLQLYVGTPHARDSIYARTVAAPVSEDGTESAPFLSGFDRFEAPIFDRAGRSRWPERFSLDRIAALRRRSRPGRFDAQMLLVPTDPAEGHLAAGNLVVYDGELDVTEGNGFRTLRLEGHLLVSAAAAWDPALGHAGSRDRSVAAAVYFDDDGRAFIHDVEYHALDPGSVAREPEAVQLCARIAAFVERGLLPSVMVESNGIGAYLPNFLRAELRRRGVSCAVVQQVSTAPKHRRIIDGFAPRLAAGRLYAHRRVMAGPFAQELRAWQPEGKGHDDGLDAVSACLLAVPVRFRLFDPAPRPPPWRPATLPARARSDFDPLDSERTR
jgi:hypothetical protein